MFWMQEARKTASYMLQDYDKPSIKAIAWEKNIYQVKAEYQAYKVLNGTHRRLVQLLKEELFVRNYIKYLKEKINKGNKGFKIRELNLI